MYNAGPTPSLLNGSGDGKSIPGSRESAGLASLHSPPQSRSSSAQDSYSTSATTFEDSDDKRMRNEGQDQVEDAKRGRDSGAKDKEVKGNVIVSVRVRPDAGGDKSSGRDWLVDGRQSLVSFKGREGGDYYYDNVFAPYDKNHKVYDASAKRLVRRVMEGYHGTVFAYGMTGTGKTFSMQGTTNSPGVIPLAITDIFSYIRETPTREFLLRVSYLEIYNEKIHDLLTQPPAAGIGPGSPQPEEIKLREDSKRGVFASPLKEEIVQSPTQLLRVIARGDQSRKTRSTQYNAQSSRSHAVVQIVVESRERAPSNGKMGNDKRAPLVPGGVRVSTLSMIDLAGSERAAESKERRTEGAHINKSLLTLGTVIARLSGDKDSSGNPTDKDGKHLPYRDSKLTRLLQPALSGNSLVSILCTIQIGSAGSVATANGHIGETLNTLKFAARAKNNIVSHAKKAEEALGTAGDGGSRVLLERYRMEILDLKGQLEAQKKDQDKKVEEEEREPEMGSDQRHEEQILEIHLARTALQRRMDDLKRLILSSKSSGVNANSNGKLSSLSMHPTLSVHDKSESSSRTLRSLRSSASHSTLGTATPSLSRNLSQGSTTRAGQGADSQQSPISSQDNEDDDSLGDEKASSRARIRALQADLADKNRYISTLEKRLLQARRSSTSRASLLVSPTRRNFSPLEEPPSNNVLQEKDIEIAELRARLDDKDRMLNALRAVARNRDTADPASEPISPPIDGNRDFHHQSKNSNETGSSASSRKPLQSPLGPVPQSPAPLSPVRLLSPQKDRQKEKESKRKSIDEMTKILDGMIQDRVQNGGMIIGANGVVKPAHERRKESLGAVPSVGALAAQLRPASTISEAEQ